MTASTKVLAYEYKNATLTHACATKQLQPILQLWQTITSSNSALKPVNHGMVVENAAPVDAFVAMESEAALQLVNMAAAALSSADRVLKGSDLLTAGILTFCLLY